MALQSFGEGKSYCLVCKLMRGKLDKDYINSSDEESDDSRDYDFYPSECVMYTAINRN